VKITCPTCSAKYSIADDKVENRLAKIRCRKCGATIVIDGKVSPVRVYAAEGEAAGASAPPAAGADAASYSVDLGGGEPRAMTVAEIVAAMAKGEVTNETFVWIDGFADWKPIKNVPELAAAAKGGGARPSSKTPARTASRGASAAPAAQAGAKTPWDDSGAKAASRAQARGASGRDLFGGIATAGSEEEVTTSAPEEPPAPAITGARNESSVLFSLAALTATTGGGSPAGDSAPVLVGKARKEDSGLIDLKALAASGEQQQASPLAMPAPLLGLAAPLGLAPPLGGGVESSISIPEPPPPKSRAGMFVAGAVVLAGAAVAITVAATSGSREPAAPPTPSVVIVERTVTRPAEAKPPPTGDVEENKDAGAKKKVGGGRWPAGKGKGKGGGEEPGGGGESAPAAAAKPTGCPPGDLACAIRQRAQK
jgi:predicted Zn finger-like uncharacterized protein